MTTQEIVKLVQEKADARFGETVERLLLILRQKHTHSCWKKECDCNYCQFINNEYVSAKLQLHKIKKRIRHLEYLYNIEWKEGFQCLSLTFAERMQKDKVWYLKEYKKELQKDIL